MTMKPTPDTHDPGRDLEAKKGSGEYARSGDSRPSILLVDDTAANLLALEAVLAPLGHRLVRAMSGEEALRCMLKEEFCLALIDVQMGGMDGFETAALIKSHPRIAQTPLIFVTAISGEAKHVFQGYSHGAVDYLVKPFEPQILRSKVSVFVDLYLRGRRILEQDRLLRQQELATLGKRSEERYRGLAESVPVIVWAVSPDGGIHYCNQAWTAYSGLPFEPGGDVADARFVHADDLERTRTSWLLARKNGTQWEVEYRLRRSDGEYRWHLGRALPEREGGARISGWIVTATDIDERKRTDDLRAKLLKQEQRAREQAEAANQAKDEFLATVSHELRAPLSAIIGWVHMLKGGMLDENRKVHALETIDRNAQIQRSLVEDILDVSRIIAGKTTLELEPVCLGKVAEAAIEAARPAAGAKGVTIEREIAWGKDEVIGDPRRLQQALGNLLSNAIKFTPPGGKISIRLSGDERAVSICVTDTGIGIRQDFLPHVFERFRQADGSSTRAHGGLGLGLAIVRHIVEQHGGTVRAESNGPGTGTSLTLTLPAEPRLSERLLRAATPLSDGPTLLGLHVLLVDDEADARELVEEFLRGQGADVSTATSAEEALARLQEVRPHVLVSDIGMPKEDGFTLMRRIRQLSPNDGGAVPAIAVTGLASREDARRALTAGFQEHLPKPLQLDKLLETVARLGRPALEPSEKSEQREERRDHGV
jgi:PAS domain S-box-containing protein